MTDVEFLSDDWLAALDEAARARDGGDDDPLADVHLSIEQVVSDERRWRLVVAGGDLSVIPESSFAGEADIRLTSDRATATAVARGQRPALDAFIAGDLVLGGNVQALLEHRAALESIGDLFAAVRDRTEFS